MGGTISQALKAGIVEAGRRVPWVTNPLWTAIYPHIRKNEYYAGAEYHDDRQAVFEKIYDSNLWYSDESRSGVGSTMAQTESIRAQLPRLLASLNAKQIYDAPCGDFNWMRHVALAPDVHYLGADVVRPLIERLQREFGDSHRRFRVGDIVEEIAPECDVWLCRDVLFHLPTSDVMRVLANIDPAKTRYLLTTTFPWVNANRDVHAGGFRYINLQNSPFFLPPPMRTIDDFNFPEPPRVLGLWPATAIAQAAARFAPRKIPSV